LPFCPLAIFAGLIPVTLGGIGIRDMAIVFLTSGWVAGEQAMAVGILYTATSYWFLGVLGLPFLWMKRGNREEGRG
jgi:uncharacterized membrane protein YbhN (UPF0104 family)